MRAASLPDRAQFRRFLAIPTRRMDNDICGHADNVVYYSYFDTVVNGFLIERGMLDPDSSEVIGLAAESGCQCVDRRSRRPMPLPAPLRATLETLIA